MVFDRTHGFSGSFYRKDKANKTTIIKKIYELGEHKHLNRIQVPPDLFLKNRDFSSTPTMKPR